MIPKKRKALLGVVSSFNQHKGHTIHRRDGTSFVLKEALLIGERVMLKAEGSPFASISGNENFKECSCGEGKQNES